MSKGNNGGGSGIGSVILGILVLAMLSITIFTNFKDIGNHSPTNMNANSAVETEDCVTISAENYVCHAQRGKVAPHMDPHMLRGVYESFRRAPSDWKCFLLIFGVIAVFVGLAMSNKNGQQ